MKKLLSLTFVGLILASLVACGGGTSTTTNAQPGAVFVTGEDAPLPSVLAFNVTLNNITLNNSSGSVSVLSTPQTVDFARLLGLRTLVGFNSVPAGTYTSATVQLANPQIVYLDLTTNPPSAVTINGTLTSPTVTVAFNKPMVVDTNGLAGLKMDFDLRQSIQIDPTTKQITGSVNPTLDFKVVGATDPDADVDDLRGSFISSNVASNSFVMQRPDGRQITIVVNANTTFNGSNNLGNLAAPEFIEVDGTVQNDGSILASSVEVVSTSRAFVSGRIISVTNDGSGNAQSVTLLVGEEMPAMSSVPVDMPATIDVSGVNKYAICFVNNWFTGQLFNSTTLVAGQRVFIGGTYDSTANAFTAAGISLRRQGVVGDLVANSVTISNGNLGSFQLQNNLMLGYVLGGPLTVQTSNKTNFINVNGLAGLQAAGSAKLIVHGLILKDQTTGAPVMWAHRVRVLP
jgi:hypothetical protein